MEYKILEANGIDNENVDGAAFNNFTAAGRNGIIKGVLNECEVYSPSSNSVSVKTGELLIQGFRIKITDPYVITFSSTPAVPIRYQLVARIVLGADRSISFGIEYREEKELVQEDLYQAERGTYEVILAWFTHSEKGIVDLAASVKTITVDVTQVYDALLNLQAYVDEFFVHKTTDTSVLYATSDTGQEVKVPYSYDTVSNAIPRRDSRGHISVPYEPEQDYDATSKKYVDERIESGTVALRGDYDRAIKSLYAITAQSGLYTVLETEQAYVSRTTADGESIVDGVQTTVKEIRGKTVATENLIPFPYTESTSTRGGVTFTVNSDGTITVNGIANNDLSFGLFVGELFFNGDITLSGCVGGSPYTYYVQIYINGSSQDIQYDKSKTYSINGNLTRVAFFVKSGASFNNVVLRPMLNIGTEAKSYMPYFPGLKNASFEKIVSTGRNLIPYPYAETTKTQNGVTFAVNSDGTITVNGTATESTIFTVFRGNIPLSGTFTLSGCVGGSATTYYIQPYIDGVARQVQLNEAVTYNWDGNLTFLRFYVIAGVTINNLVFRPMLQFGTTATAYEPYISDTLSVETPIELAEYDTAYPETGEIQRQSNTLTFNGTENWYLVGNTENNFYNYRYYVPIPVTGTKNKAPCICNKYDYKLSVENDRGNDIGILVIGDYVYIRLGSGSMIKSVTEWKSQLAAWNEAGNPLTVTYKTAEATTEATPFDKSKYIAWKNGSETIEQGSTDNSEYGAMPTVTQEYFKLTGV